MSNVKIEGFRQWARQTDIVKSYTMSSWLSQEGKSDILKCVTCFRPPECHRDREASAHYAGGGGGAGQLELFICKQN